jgi:hypothetical protein
MLALQRTPLGKLTNFNTRCHEPTGLIERFVQTLDAFIEIASRRRFDCQPQLVLLVLLAKRCARLQVSSKSLTWLISIYRSKNLYDFLNFHILLLRFEME